MIIMNEEISRNNADARKQQCSFELVGLGAT